METIKNYLDNMFSGLPKTARLADLKNNILSNMEEKYHALKNQGKSENEAIGIVISEFGNIDELVSELGIQKGDEANSLPIVTEEEAEAYIKAKISVGKLTSLGVFLCITGPALLILLSGLFEYNIIPNHLSETGRDIPGLIGLFICITIAVGIFIYSGMTFERFQYMENGVQLPTGLEFRLKQRYDSYTPTFYAHIIVGVCLLILSPISIFVASLYADPAANFGVVVLLLIVAFAVTLFINSGMVRESYEHLLRIGDYKPQTEETKKRENKVIGAVASIVWPLAAGIFLFAGFVYHLWNIAWVVFPITGILFGMFCAAFSILADKSK